MKTYDLSIEDKRILNLQSVRLVKLAPGEDTLRFTMDSLIDTTYTWYISYKLFNGEGSVVLIEDVTSVTDEKGNTVTQVSWTPDNGALSAAGILEFQIFAIDKAETKKYSSYIGKINVLEAIDNDLTAPDGEDVFVEWMTKYQTLYDEFKAEKGEKGKPNGIATLDGDGYLTKSQFNPEFNEVWDSYIVAGSEICTAGWLSHTPGGTPFTPVEDRLYVVKTEGIYHGRLYHWDADTQLYGLSGTDLVLGTSHDNAYYGDLGKIAYDHTFMTQNPHRVTKAQVGLSEADNTADIDKNVLSATKFTTPILVSVTDAVVSTPTTLTGLTNVEIPITSIDASFIHGDMILSTLEVGILTSDKIVPKSSIGEVGSTDNRYKSVFADTVDSITDTTYTILASEGTITTLGSTTITAKNITADHITGALSGNATSADKVNHILTGDSSIAPAHTEFDGSLPVSVYVPNQMLNTSSHVTFDEVTALLDGSLTGGSVGAVVFQKAVDTKDFLSLPEDIATDVRYVLSPTVSGPTWNPTATDAEMDSVVEEIFG